MRQINYFKFESNFHYVGFEVLTAVVINTSVFWDITLCSPLKVSPRFRERIASTFRVEKYAALLAT
jgi:hypothetical protein